MAVVVVANSGVHVLVLDFLFDLWSGLMVWMGSYLANMVKLVFFVVSLDHHMMTTSGWPSHSLIDCYSVCVCVCVRLLYCIEANDFWWCRRRTKTLTMRVANVWMTFILVPTIVACIVERRLVLFAVVFSMDWTSCHQLIWTVLGNMTQN